MFKARNIAVVLPSWVGDAVMATPALRAIREHFPAAKITHIGRAGPLEVLDGGSLRDDAVTDLSATRPRAVNMLKQIARVRKGRYDLAILLPNSFRSALLCRLGKVKRLVGYDRDGRGWMLDEKLSPARDADGRIETVAAIDYYNALAAGVGAPPTDRRMSLSVSQPSATAAETLFNRAGIDRSGPVVMLNPGGSFGPSKLWPAERFAALADMLIDRRGAEIIINAAPGERAIAGEVAGAMRHRPAANLAEIDNSLSLLKGIVQLCSLLVTNDTGARHIAAALGTDVVTIFGSTDPRLTVIDCPRERIVRTDVPCSPCQKKKCPNPPGPRFHQCMRAVTTEMVLAAACELLDSAPPRPAPSRPAPSRPAPPRPAPPRPMEVNE